MDITRPYNLTYHNITLLSPSVLCKDVNISIHVNPVLSEQMTLRCREIASKLGLNIFCANAFAFSHLSLYNFYVSDVLEHNRKEERSCTENCFPMGEITGEKGN